MEFAQSLVGAFFAIFGTIIAVIEFFVPKKDLERLRDLLIRYWVFLDEIDFTYLFRYSSNYIVAFLAGTVLSIISSVIIFSNESALRYYTNGDPLHISDISSEFIVFMSIYLAVIIIIISIIIINIRIFC